MKTLVDTHIYLEVLGEVNTYFGTGIKIVTAIFLGAIIGLDREKKLKSAGIKTQILICLGSALYTSISLMVYQANGEIGDPNRVAAQIVSGIGFLGAGSIIHHKGSIVGMTTAAAIWVVAAMGMAVGAGYIVSATFFAVTTLVVLNLVEPFIRFIQSEKHFHIEVIGDQEASEELEKLLTELETNIISKAYFSNESSHKFNIHLNIKSNNRELKKIIDFCNASPKIEQYTFKAMK